jgi:hypothetical protein
MARDQRPAVVYLRMSAQLRAGLRVAADDAGCSLNAFAVQVLAAAAGDPARFRGPAATTPVEPATIERDSKGYPLDWSARDDHIVARGDFIETTWRELGDAEMHVLVKKYDAEDPGYFVEWRRAKMIERAAEERAYRHDGPSGGAA